MPGPLDDFITRYFTRTPTGDFAGWSSEPVAEWDGPEGDDDLIAMACKSGQRSPAAVFGDGDIVTFKALWEADAAPLSKRWPGEGMKPYDASSADMALASHLAFWTGKNCERIERLMRRSGLARDKWDHHRSYLGDTILKACAFVQKIATGGKEADPAAVASGAGEAWPEPKPLPSALPPVAPFDGDLLPEALRAWVMDIADRMQCPPDYVAVSAIVATAGVVGRKVGIRPQEHTDWTEVPNLWGCVVGRPGVMKSPAMAYALKPLRRLDALAAEAAARDLRDHEAQLERFKLEQTAVRAAVRKGEASGSALGEREPQAPPVKRYIVNDATYEALGVIMADNPNGVMIFRDELVSMLKPLDREENAPARGFFLTAWNGTDGYTFDRIMRGRTHIEACCLSVLGATQPAKLRAYLNHAVRGGSGDDGFSQRFGLLVWPDVSQHWSNIDRPPDVHNIRRANLTFDHLNALDPHAIGATIDQFDRIPYLRFDRAALATFTAWRSELEQRLRGDELHDAMQAHLNKYRGLVPKLALLFHLIEGAIGPVALSALERAIRWAAYLETHAARAYASVTAARSQGARTIVAKLRSGSLCSPFTARDVHQADWSGLTERDDVTAALALLVEYDWLTDAVVATVGRPKTIFTVNPRAMGS